MLNLTQHIGDGFELGPIPGAAFFDLRASHDTISHRRLVDKLVMLTDDVPLTMLIRTTLSTRRFKVELNGKHSRWRNQRNGLPKAWWYPLCCSTCTTSHFQLPPTFSSTPTTCALPANRRRSNRWRIASPAD